MKLLRDMASAVGEIANLNDIHSFAATAVRGLRGLIVHPYCVENPPRPKLPLEIYEFESCPFCRKVRDVCTELDLAFISRTSAKGSVTKRAELLKTGGKALYPYLVDPNTGTALYESEDIITYLASTYGPGRGAASKFFSPVNTTFSAAASIVRPRGGRVLEGLEEREQPPALLELYNMEASPYCRKVRERLNELNLDYLTLNVGKNSARREELKERGGKVMVPFLVDPNEDHALYESDQILAYLDHTYGPTA